MPDILKDDHSDYSRFDTMSTEELKEILYQDSFRSDSDLDAVLYIMELLIRRAKEDPNCAIPDVGEAWASFQKNYAPLIGSGESIWEI